MKQLYVWCRLVCLVVVFAGAHSARATTPVKLCLSAVGTVTAVANTSQCPALTTQTYIVQAEAGTSNGSFTYHATITPGSGTSPSLSITNQDQAIDSSGNSVAWLQGAAASQSGPISTLRFTIAPGIVNGQSTLDCTATNLSLGGDALVATNFSTYARDGVYTFSLQASSSQGTGNSFVPDQPFEVSCTGF